MSRRSLLALLILLLAAWVRFGALAADARFHGDEALFATYGRGAAVYGDWMLPGPLDKPPLSLYAMALSMQFTGVTTLPDGVLTLDVKRGEWSARLPGVLAGIITVALLMSAAQRLGGRYAGLFAGALAALSPQMTAYSATAFTDPVMLAFMTASLATGLHGRGAWSGLWLAAAFASKQQALFYFPLVAALNAFSVPRAIDSPWNGQRFRSFLTTLGLGLGALVLWDAARPEASLFAYAADNNNPYRTLVPVSEWGMRVSQWAAHFATAFGAWPVSAMVGLSAAAGGLMLPKVHAASSKRACLRRPEALLLLFTLAYLIAHIVLPFNTYDRYLLPVYPPAVVLAALALARLARRSWMPLTLVALLVMSLSAPARFPTDVRDRDDGLIALADFINAQEMGTIVYNRWLGWEMNYYLGPWSDKRSVYYPSPEQFAADSPLNPDRAPRLFIAPAWAFTGEWLDAAADAGFSTRSAYRSADYVAFWLERDD